MSANAMPLIENFNFNFNFNAKVDFSSKDIPICQTKIVRGGRGMPWDKRIALHPMGDGHFEMAKLEVEDKKLIE